MGIAKWLARKGNVGGTARWAAKMYFTMKERAPDASVEQIMEEMVALRYPSVAMKAARNALIATIDNGDMRGLAHLVTNILSIEAGFRENTPENRSMFMDIIEEELAKLGVPEKHIYDYSKPAF